MSSPRKTSPKKSAKIPDLTKEASKNEGYRYAKNDLPFQEKFNPYEGAAENITQKNYFKRRKETQKSQGDGFDKDEFDKEKFDQEFSNDKKNRGSSINTKFPDINKKASYF